MNTQDIFNKVAFHLLTQNERSTDEFGHGCRYRGINGLRCAIGCLIPDEEYDSSLEMGIYNLLLDNYYIGDRPILTSLIPHVKILDELQSVHDREEVYNWKLALTEVAVKHHLDSSVLNNF